MRNYNVTLFKFFLNSNLIIVKYKSSYNNYIKNKGFIMEFRTPNSITDLYQAFEVIKPISNFYPNFSDWYWDKVVPGIMLGTDKIIMAEKRGELVGISLIKDGEEKKLRALRINPSSLRSNTYG